MKLELKHLAPYLPHGLKGRFIKHDDIVTELDAVHNVISSLNNGNYEIKHFRPYLRPLSDLKKEIEVNGEKFVPMERLELELGGCSCDAYSEYLEIFYDDICSTRAIQAPYEIFEIWLKWHFDVFGLIKDGLAIDINTLKK